MSLSRLICICRCRGNGISQFVVGVFLIYTVPENDLLDGLDFTGSEQQSPTPPALLQMIMIEPTGGGGGAVLTAKLVQSSRVAGNGWVSTTREHVSAQLVRRRGIITAATAIYLM